jgi:hypothetical protein
MAKRVFKSGGWMWRTEMLPTGSMASIPDPNDCQRSSIFPWASAGKSTRL